MGDAVAATAASKSSRGSAYDLERTVEIVVVNLIPRDSQVVAVVVRVEA